jgi:hypothetical protein
MIYDDRVKSIAVAKHAAGEPDASEAASDAEKATYAAVLALNDAMEAISTKEKANNERGERAKTTSVLSNMQPGTEKKEAKKERKLHSINTITWTEEDNLMIVRVMTVMGGYSYNNIAIGTEEKPKTA